MGMNTRILLMLVFTFLTCGSPLKVTAQQLLSAPRRSVLSAPSSPGRPVSLPHVYWHFLIYQNHLDQKAAELQSQGKNGQFFRDHFQTKLGWSDADFAPIRTASVRLSSELKDLDARAAAIRSVAVPKTSSQLNDLVVQRESDINAEITYIKQKLPPDKIEALEGFLVPYFAPKNIPKPTQVNQAK